MERRQGDHRELAIIGTDIGDTVVCLLGGVNPDLIEFLRRTSSGENRPVLVNGTIWIPSAHELEQRLLQETGSAPTSRQRRFLSELQCFLSNLYFSHVFHRPGERGAGGETLQNYIVGCRVIAYIQHTRVVPSFMREQLVQFAFSFLVSIG